MRTRKLGAGHLVQLSPSPRTAGAASSMPHLLRPYCDTATLSSIALMLPSAVERSLKPIQESWIYNSRLGAIEEFCAHWQDCNLLSMATFRHKWRTYGDADVALPQCSTPGEWCGFCRYRMIRIWHTDKSPLRRGWARLLVAGADGGWRRAKSIGGVCTE